MNLPFLTGSGLPEVEAVLNEYAAAIGRLERLIQAIQLSGGGGGCHIGTVQSGGISAATDDNTPGTGNVMIRQVYPGATVGTFGLRDMETVVPVLNIAMGSLGAIAAGKQIATMPILNRPGHQLVILDPCPPV